MPVAYSCLEGLARFLRHVVPFVRSCQGPMRIWLSESLFMSLVNSDQMNQTGLDQEPSMGQGAAPDEAGVLRGYRSKTA